MTVYYPTYRPMVSPLTLETQVLELPLAGEVLVRMGNRVEPDEVVARTLVPARGQRFAVARALGISEKELPACLVLEDGAVVGVGQVVARLGRLRQRFWRAPIAGVLSTAEAERGYLVLTPEARSFELRAPIKGFVAAVEPFRAVTLQTPAAVVQGVFGLGGAQHGVLRMAVTAAEDELLPEMIDARCALAIVIGGGPVGAEALAQAVEQQVRGLIVGSITVEALQSFLGYRDDMDWQVGANGWCFPPAVVRRDFPLTVVVTEGVGRHAMCARAFELLASYDGWEAYLDGRTWLHGPAMRRPQVVIPLPRANPAEIASEGDSEQLIPGCEVRLLGSDSLGRTGQLIALPRGMAETPGGLRFRPAEVLLEDGSVVVVPVENLEVLRLRKTTP